MSSPTPDEITGVRIECTLDADDTTTLPDIVVVYQWSWGGGSVLATAALCCEWLAGRVGTTAFRWSADGTTIDKTMQAEHWRRRAAELWMRADSASAGSSGSGVGVISIAHAEAVGANSDDDEFSA